MLLNNNPLLRLNIHQSLRFIIRIGPTCNGLGWTQLNSGFVLQRGALIPIEGYTASNLDKGEYVAGRDVDNLLRLDEIGRIALMINTSSVESRTSSFNTTTGNESIACYSPTCGRGIRSLGDFNKTENYGSYVVLHTERGPTDFCNFIENTSPVL